MSATVLNYIPDGYDEPGYIKENPGLHGELRFRFRPMLRADRIVIVTAAANLPPEKRGANAAKAIKARLILWDLKDKDGKPQEITEENILRLKPALFDRLEDIVYGYSASDPDPQWTADQKQADTEAALNAALEGTTYRSEPEAVDQGNLPAASG